MGSFNIQSSTQIPRLHVDVYLGGRKRSDVHCTEISFGAGIEGAVAGLVIPSAYWDSGKADLRGKSVEVRAGYGLDRETIFAGWVMKHRGVLKGQAVQAEARSPMGFAERVYIGQHFDSQDMTVRYPARALYNGTLRSTNWTLKSILRDWFNPNSRSWRGGGGAIPSDWRAKVKLGNLSVLSTSWNQFPLGDLIYRQMTLAEALNQLLGIVGTVSFRERFVAGGRTYLDFFELADPAATVHPMRVALRGESVEGTNILEVDHEEGVEDVRNRIKGIGAPKKFVVSVTTGHASAPLVKNWDPSLESTVLQDPQAVKEKLLQEAMTAEEEAEKQALAKVFREYLLPEELRGFAIHKDLGIETSDGRTLPIQIWKIGRNLTIDESTGDVTSTAATTPVLLGNAKLDPASWKITLSEPAINMVSGTVTEGVLVDVYEEAEVGVTLCLLGDALAYDTGVRRGGVALDGIDQDGLVEVIQNDSFEWAQIGSAGLEIDGGVTYSTVKVNLADNSWETYTTATSVRDDSRPLAYFTEGALRERFGISTAYNIVTPFWTSGYRLGDRIQLVNQADYIIGTHQIKSLKYDLKHDHRVTIGTDNAVPLVSQTILSSGGSQQ